VLGAGGWIFNAAEKQIEHQQRHKTNPFPAWRQRSCQHSRWRERLSRTPLQRFCQLWHFFCRELHYSGFVSCCIFLSRTPLQRFYQLQGFFCRELHYSGFVSYSVFGQLQAGKFILPTATIVMGTRSIIRVVDEFGALILAFWLQCDSHPNVYGVLLAAFLRCAFNGQEVSGGTFNGMDDLAAQIVMHCKSSTADGSVWGNLYIIPAAQALDPPQRQYRCFF